MFDKYIKLYYELPKYLIGMHGDINLTLLDVCVLGEIISLSNNDKHCCYASNSMLADTFHVSERQIQKSIKKLEIMQVIKRFSENNQNSYITKNRFIYPQMDVLEQIVEFKMDEEKNTRTTVHPNIQDTRTTVHPFTNQSSPIHELQDTDTRTVVHPNIIIDNKDNNIYHEPEFVEDNSSNNNNKNCYYDIDDDIYYEKNANDDCLPF